MTTSAVVLAGGIGARMRADRPKQLLELRGVTVLERSVRAFVDAPGIDSVVVMLPADHVGELSPSILGWGADAVHAGGVARHDTVRLALDVLPPGATRVLLHDAARPLVSPEVIARAVAALDSHRAAGVFVESTDTVVEVSADGAFVTAPLERSRLRRAQTPQAFHVDLLRLAHERAAADSSFEPTDDCGVVARYAPDVPIAVVAGQTRNLKVTEPVDLVLAEYFLGDQ